MPSKKVKLLLLKSVENLGIVGDIVKVRPGFARNYLRPHQLAEAPTPKKIESLKEERAKAEAELAQLRRVREEIIARLEAVTIGMQRSCNDQGVLYGSVTQRDISDALVAAGYGVDTRAVRLSQPIRRVGSYHVLVQFERDLKADITLNIEPDRALETREEVEVDEEGEMVESGAARGGRRRTREAGAPPAAEPAVQPVQAKEAPAPKARKKTAKSE